MLARPKLAGEGSERNTRLYTAWRLRALGGFRVFGVFEVLVAAGFGYLGGRPSGQKGQRGVGCRGMFGGGNGGPHTSRPGVPSFADSLAARFGRATEACTRGRKRIITIKKNNL